MKAYYVSFRNLLKLQSRVQLTVTNCGEERGLFNHWFIEKEKILFKMIVKIFVVAAAVGFAFVSSQGVIPGVANSCFFPENAGHCKGRIPSFYYRPETGSCDCFVYTGCGGNGNQFETLDDCMSECNVNRNQQVITPTCRNLFSGTQTLEEMLKKFGRQRFT